MAVNDVFVMNAWGKSSNVGDKILMLADGNGDYAKALGLELDAHGFGMGTRGQRFSILVQDGVAKQVTSRPRASSRSRQPSTFSVRFLSASRTFSPASRSAKPSVSGASRREG